VLFLAFSLAAAASPNFAALVLLRTGQAVVGAAVIPNGMAMLRESIPAERLGRANGITGSVIGLSAAIGPVLGAAALSAGAWRLIFLVNVPIVAAALATLTLLRRPPVTGGRNVSLDWRGALLVAAVLVALTQFFVVARSGPAALLLATSAVVISLLWVLVLDQRGRAVQVAEWRLLRHRPFFGATSYVLTSNLVMYTTLLAVPFFLREVQDKPVETAGLLLGVMSGIMMVVAPFAGLLSDRHGRRPLALGGGLLQLTAVVLLLFGLNAQLSTAYLAVCLVLLGLGIGFGTGPASTAAIESAPLEVVGAAAGTSSMMRYFGSIVGVGVLGAVLNSDGATPTVGLFQGLFALLVILALAAIAAASLVHVRARPVAAGGPQQADRP
jgi:MFS family permease